MDVIFYYLHIKKRKYNYGKNKSKLNITINKNHKYGTDYLRLNINNYEFNVFTDCGEFFIYFNTPNNVYRIMVHKLFTVIKFPKNKK